MKAVANICFDLADGDDGSDMQEVEEDWIDEVDMILTPTSGQAMPTDNFVVDWEYDGYLTGVATIKVYYYDEEEDEEGYGVASTTVDWFQSSITLPPRFLPHVHPGSTSSIWLWAYTMTGSDPDEPSDYFSFYPDIELYASETSTPPATVTHTVTASRTDDSSTTQTEDPGPTSSTPDSDNGSESGGLSTGGKAGIGVGVSAGAILVAAGAFLLVRRRKRQEPKTIREIPATSATNLPGAAL